MKNTEGDGGNAANSSTSRAFIPPCNLEKGRLLSDQSLVFKLKHQPEP